MVNSKRPRFANEVLEQSVAKHVVRRVQSAGFPKMALLAYLIMVACLMTSIFVGFEWVATSSPRLTMARPTHTATHTRLAGRSEFAATEPSPKSSGAQDDPNSANLNQFVVSSEDERAHERRQVARARHHRLRIMAQRWNRPVLGRTALGYTDEPIAGGGRDRTD
jgi:hypothetical protein